MADRLSWGEKERALVVELFAREMPESARRRELTEVVGPGGAERFLEARRALRRETRVEEVLREVSRLVGEIAPGLPRETAESVREELEHASVRIVELSFTPRESSGERMAWREILEKQRGIAGDLRETLRTDLGGVLEERHIDDLYEGWRRAQPVPVR